MENKKIRQFWTIEEDNLLKKGIELYGLKNWEIISKFVGNNRTKYQCLQRWKRDINPLIKREKWNIEEDKYLIILVNKYGLKSWTKISIEFKNRTDVQCKFRYNYLIKNLNLNQNFKIEKIFEKFSYYINNFANMPSIWDEQF